MPVLTREGTNLYYEEAGGGDPPFLFVHGWTCNHSHFAPQFEHFRAEHRVVSVDLRGHGRSDQPQQEYTIAGFADDLAWWCTELGVLRPVVVGHSMGAIITLELAARHPHIPRAIVMLDAAPIVAAPAMADIGAGVLAALHGPDAAAARSALIEHAVAPIHDDPALRDQIAADMQGTAEHVARSCIGHMTTWDGESAMRDCAVPALHISADDPINDAASLRGLNPLIRTGQTVGAGHFHQLEVPDQVNAMIERFLRVDL